MPSQGPVGSPQSHASPRVPPGVEVSGLSVGYTRSIKAGYDLSIDMPDSDASDFAWFYGGAASFELGQCDNAQA